jgi:hypothetical protein
MIKIKDDLKYFWINSDSLLFFAIQFLFISQDLIDNLKNFQMKEFEIIFRRILMFNLEYKYIFLTSYHYIKE